MQREAYPSSEPHPPSLLTSMYAYTLEMGIPVEFGDGIPFMSIVQPLTGKEIYCDS